MRHFKSLLVLFCGLLITININADQQTIITENAGWHTTTRSLTSLPELYQNGDTIFIDSEYALFNLNITIEDLSNNIIQSSTITVLGGEEYSYIVYANPGTYKVTLTQGSKSLYGYFTIEE